MSESRKISLVSDRERGSVHLMSKGYEVSLVSEIDRVQLMNERLSSKVSSASQRERGSTHLVSKSSEMCILLSTRGGVHLVRCRGILVCIKETLWFRLYTLDGRAMPYIGHFPCICLSIL